MLNIIKISRSESCYPEAVHKYLGKESPDVIYTLGNLDLLKLNKRAFFCSTKCTGNIILKSFDYFNRLMSSQTAIIGGFHSPMEKECLNILFKWSAPVVICFARSLNNARTPKTWNSMIQSGGMLLLSPFPEKTRGISKKSALFCNDFIAVIADEIFVPYAAPGSKTETFCRKIHDWGKPLFTFDSPENAHLISCGIQTIEM